MKTFTYTITGPREFPINALTHDQCWPADEQTATEIGMSWSQPRGVSKPRTYRLIGLKEPTVHEWQRWGFTVGRI